METENVTPNLSMTPEPEEHKKNNIESRAVFALAFSTLGAKLGLFGMAADGASILHGESNKLSAIFNGKLKTKLLEKLAEELKQSGATDSPAAIKASTKILKYTIIFSTAGAVLGGILGWVRGDRVEKPSDILHHPITSLKLVLGISSKPKEPDSENTAAKTDAIAPPTPDTVDTATSWRERTGQQQAMMTVNR